MLVGDLFVPELAGGIIGGVMFIILIFISAAAVAYLLKRQKDKKEITPSSKSKELISSLNVESKK